MKRLIELATSDIDLKVARSVLAAGGAAWLEWKKAGLRDLLPARWRRLLLGNDRIVITVAPGELDVTVKAEDASGGVRAINIPARPLDAVLIASAMLPQMSTGSQSC